MTTYWCEYAWLDDGVFEGVRLDVADGSITTVEIGAPREGTILWGLTVPGFANAHSHVFHRALRGRTHGERGTFWTWRERMYRLAAVLDPDTYYRLARAVYAEMVLAGYTSVGEFHYLHHAPGGVRYNDPNVMSAALDAAATEAGIRLCLLDTCYLSSGFGAAVGEQQARFADADVHGWAGRAAAFRPHGELVRTGVAAHSVRAVPPEALPVIRARAATGPLHVHLSEQRDENEQCRRVYGRSPTEVLHDGGVLGERTVAVHATHLGERDVGLLGSTGTGVCCCPTTERDLGDGIGPAQALASSGAALSLGSDSHAVIDPVEESRALEMHERLASEQRGRFSTDELLSAACNHSAVGWPEAGRIAPGTAADFVSIELRSVRTAGTDPSGALLAATAADVRDVVIAGNPVVSGGEHRYVRAPAAALAADIGALWN